MGRHACFISIISAYHFLKRISAYHFLKRYKILLRPYNRANMDGIDPVTPPSSPQIEPEPEVEGVIVDDIHMIHNS